MTPREFYQSLAQSDLAQSEPHIVPVPSLPIKIGPQDIIAARLLLWLEKQMPEDATQGDLDDVLDAAKWWNTFFDSAFAAAVHEAPKSEGGAG